MSEEKNKIGRRRDDALHLPVFLAELETKNAKLARRILCMAWPYTPEGILQRINVSAFSFSSEQGIITVAMDIFSRDVERAAGNRNIPFSTAVILLKEMTDRSVSVIQSSLKFKEHHAEHGEDMDDLCRAFFMMTRPIH